MLDADSSWTNLSLGNTESRSRQDHEKVHAEDTSGRVILKTKINVLRDTETKATSAREVLFLQLVLLDFQTTIQQFVGFKSSHLQHNSVTELK